MTQPKTSGKLQEFLQDSRDKFDMITLIGMVYSLVFLLVWAVGVVVTGSWPPTAFTAIVGAVVLSYLGLQKLAEIIAKKVDGGAYEPPPAVDMAISGDSPIIIPPVH